MSTQDRIDTQSQASNRGEGARVEEWLRYVRVHRRLLDQATQLNAR